MTYSALVSIFAAILAWPTQTLCKGNVQQNRYSSETNNSTTCSNPTHWFTQHVDHSGSTNGTFQQKYYISTEHYKHGGPILFFQGAEATSLDLQCLDRSIFHDFAKELNGIAVALEHRYFGESVPFGADLSNYTPQQWKYLTLDNVMDDAVYFVQSLKKNVTGAHNATTFAAGGSYGGFLMTMFRQNRPEIFTGVLASSPPIRAFFGGNETNVPDQFNWWTYVHHPLL
jgi:alpha-beta hydrolase superfamily lysophospholipase